MRATGKLSDRDVMLASNLAGDDLVFDMTDQQLSQSVMTAQHSSLLHSQLLSS
jgi:hypothetical protein